MHFTHFSVIVCLATAAWSAPTEPFEYPIMKFMDTNESLKVTYLTTNSSTCKIENVTCLSSVDTTFRRFYYYGKKVLRHTLLRGIFSSTDPSQMDVWTEGDEQSQYIDYLETDSLLVYNEDNKCGIFYIEYFEEDDQPGTPISCELRVKTNGSQIKHREWKECETMFMTYCEEPSQPIQCFPELWQKP